MHGDWDVGALVAERPLDGVRVLSLEQAVALPYATRHLADLGADVVRVQSHRRPAAASVTDLTRSKRQLGIDLSAPGGPDAFLRVAAACDVVAHNFTPRVVRRFGIDAEGVRAVNPDVVYVAVTGFGTTGPWGERPLFGPGAEAVSGHDLMIGEPDALVPGRPGTITYADDVCGLYTVLAVLAALDERDRTGAAQVVDVSLYETAVAHLGPVLAERALGAPLPTRVGDADAAAALAGVFDARGTDRHVAVTARTADDAAAMARVLGLDPAHVDRGAVARALAGRDAEEAVADLQAAGVAAAVVADVADQTTDPQLWARGFFGLLPDAGGGELPVAGPAFGGGAAAAVAPTRPVGADNRAVLTGLAGLTDAEVDDLEAAGVIGALPAGAPRDPGPVEDRLARGELARVDPHPDAWRRVRPGAAG